MKSSFIPDMVHSLHLTPDGDDTHNGSREKPFATLARALSEAATLPRETRRRIVAGGGVYPDTEAVLTESHSGLELVAAPHARPAFYGGSPIENWMQEGGSSPFWIAECAGVRESHRDFRTLVVNGRFAPRARFPESGSIRHASEFPVKWMSSTKGGWERAPTEAERTTLHLVPGSLPPTISDRNAEITVLHCWDESLVGIRWWDRERGIITFSTPAGHPPGAFGTWIPRANTLVVWNVREGMTRPGQWYLDRDRGRVVYWPLPGEHIESLTAWAPTRAAVLRLAGTEDAPVRDIYLRGLTFGLNTTPLQAGGFGALAFEGAVEGACAHGLRLDDITVKWSGGQGIRVLNSDGVRCRNCTVHDTGAGGLILSGRDGKVTQTLIHHTGRTYPSSLGMRVSGENWRVRHNTFHHTPYSAINAGGRALRFEHNRFHHVVEELLDGAAIYIFAGKSCVIRGNYTYSIREDQVHAYYLDEQSEHSRVEGNVALGVPWPIHNHMARNCVIRNNVFLNTGDMRISFTNCDRFTLTRNIFAAEGALVIEPSFTGLSTLSRNLFHSAAGEIRWTFHNRLPTLEPHAGPVPALPRNLGSLLGNPGCRCEEGKVSFDHPELAGQLGLPALDVRKAGCARTDSI